MFYIIAIDLTVLWMLGLFASYTFGGVIYILPIIAILMILANMVNERRWLHSKFHL